MKTYSTTKKVIPVKLEIGGKVEEYELREMDGSSRDRYLDNLSSRMKVDAQGKPTGVHRFEGMQAELIACTLFSKNGTKFTKEVIQQWPASTVTGLFEEAQRLNLLNQSVEQVEGEVKKD